MRQTGAVGLDGFGLPCLLVFPYEPNLLRLVTRTGGLEIWIQMKPACHKRPPFEVRVVGATYYSPLQRGDHCVC